MLGVAVGGLWTATHGVAGVAWHDVLLVLRAVTLWHLVLLTVVWLGGLGIYAVVLSAALPGVGIRRSLLLNLSGSAVANVIPLGGAVATALNWRMVRRWGHSNNSFVTFCVLTNALDVATKLLLPLVGIVTLATLSEHVPRVLWLIAVSCAASLVLVLVAQALLLRKHVDGAPEDNRRHVVLLRHVHDSGLRIRSLFLAQWGRLLPGSVGYIAAQVALLVVSLRSVGLHAPLSVVLMAAAIERLGTLVPLTPGGTGIAEIGTIAWLVASGLDPASVVAGVLLYRAFLILMEIPVGGLLLAAWAWLERSSVARPTDKVAA
ncbi:MAG: lysylphosphatidylglycerol synthase transmembrane domain-containing protein [Nocardioidaceae bacterium]